VERPYRISADVETRSNEADGVTNAALIVVYALVWIAAVAHVVHLHFEHASFGVEGTIATLLVVALPFLGIQTALQSRSRAA
jgi:hypothetical protein